MRARVVAEVDEQPVAHRHREPFGAVVDARHVSGKRRRSGAEHGHGRQRRSVRSSERSGAGSTEEDTSGSELDRRAGPSTVPSAATAVRCPASASSATGGRSVTEMLTVCGKLVLTCTARDDRKGGQGGAKRARVEVHRGHALGRVVQSAALISIASAPCTPDM